MGFGGMGRLNFYKARIDATRNAIADLPSRVHQLIPLTRYTNLQEVTYVRTRLLEAYEKANADNNTDDMKLLDDAWVLLQRIANMYYLWEIYL